MKGLDIWTFSFLGGFFTCSGTIILVCFDNFIPGFLWLFLGILLAGFGMKRAMKIDSK